MTSAPGDTDLPGGVSSLCIVVPTLGRPAALEPLLESVATSTPPDTARVVFVCDSDDWQTGQAIISAYYDRGYDFGWTVFDGTFPEKANAGIRSTFEPLVLLAADDVVFHPGWYEAAIEALTPDVDVVGTNDLTPSTAGGGHATMPLLRRSYITDPGAAFDERGSAFHEGYHHNFCETELCQLAQHRGVFTFAPESIVEHRHPEWGTRDTDDTDRKGWMVGWQDDERLFLERRAQWLA